MNPIRRLLARGSWLGLAAVLLLAPACSKRVPSPDGAFDATQRVVLSFSGERRLLGKIGQGARVEFVDHGKHYRARVRSLSEDSIVLESLVLVRTSGSSEEVMSRYRDSRVTLEPAVESTTLARTDIQKVEVVRGDSSRSLREVGFWGAAGAFLVVFLGERS